MFFLFFQGWLTLPGFLAKWTLTTLLDVNETMQYLAYFGYPITDAENQTEAIRVTREKHLDVQKKQTNRSVFLCHVIGQQGAGKSTFCQGLLKRNLAVSISLACERWREIFLSIVGVYFYN